MKPLSKFLFAAVLAAPVLVSCGKAETLSPLSEVTTETNIYSHTVTQQKAEAQLMDLLSRIEGPATRAIEGRSGYFQYEITTVMGIRK